MKLALADKPPTPFKVPPGGSASTRRAAWGPHQADGGRTVLDSKPGTAPPENYVPVVSPKRRGACRRVSRPCAQHAGERA